MSSKNLSRGGVRREKRIEGLAKGVVVHSTTSTIKRSLNLVPFLVIERPPHSNEVNSQGANPIN